MIAVGIDLLGDGWEQHPSGLYLPQAERRLTAVDLFCGAGGFSLGIIQAGFDVLAGVESDCCAAETYMTNLGAYPIDLRFVEPSDRDRFEAHLQKGLRRKGAVSRFPVSGCHRDAVDGGRGVPVFWLGDVRKLTGAQILESIGVERGELDLVVGGPPCQGYSMAGRRNVMDPRNSLVFEFARLVCEMRPRSLCMENVPGMLSMVTPEGLPVIDELCRILERGDFGEFEALRSIMTGDRRILKRQRQSKPRKVTKRRRPGMARRAGAEIGQLTTRQGRAQGGR